MSFKDGEVKKEASETESSTDESKLDAVTFCQVTKDSLDKFSAKYQLLQLFLVSFMHNLLNPALVKRSCSSSMIKNVIPGLQSKHTRHIDKNSIQPSWPNSLSGRVPLWALHKLLTDTVASTRMSVMETDCKGLWVVSCVCTYSMFQRSLPTENHNFS